MSVHHLVKSGVIQGSVLGPILFTVYLVDLIEAKIKNFADDAKIICKSSNPCRTAESRPSQSGNMVKDMGNEIK